MCCWIDSLLNLEWQGVLHLGFSGLERGVPGDFFGEPGHYLNWVEGDGLGRDFLNGVEGEILAGDFSTALTG